MVLQLSQNGVILKWWRNNWRFKCLLVLLIIQWGLAVPKVPLLSWLCLLLYTCGLTHVGSEMSFR